MDRRGENLVRPLLLAVCLHIVLISTFFIAVSPEAKTITPPPIVVIQATELTFAPSAAAEARARKEKAEEEQRRREAEEKKRLESPLGARLRRRGRASKRFGEPNGAEMEPTLPHKLSKVMSGRVCRARFFFPYV